MCVLIAFFAGGTLGLLAAGLCNVARRADDASERQMRDLRWQRWKNIRAGRQPHEDAQ